ncbi:MAG: NAD(P)/FAD-dependent oxidoreductase [Vicingaceae bacterium]|jgi:NADH dehydrogenase
MNVPKNEFKRVVIIGGGFGGLNLAKSLRNKDFQVVMLDKNNYHTFQPLLYQVATSGLEPDSIAYPIRKIFKNQQRFHFRMASVEKVNTADKVIETNIGQLDYDYLVIATGTTTNFFGMKGVEKYAMTMKTVSEALDLRSLILQNFEKALLANEEEQESYMNFPIVGGGPTGVELAGALAELKNHVLPADYPDLNIKRMKIQVIEMQDELLKSMSDNASKKALSYLKELGVDVMLNKSVASFDGDKLTFKSGEELESKTLIWAAGVRGNVINGFPETSIDRGMYVVDRTSKVKGFENIYAVGDIAYMTTPLFESGLPQVAPVANQQGTFLAKNLVRVRNNEKPLEFEYNDQGSMATIGRNRAVVDMGKIKFQGTLAWFVWMFIHLISLVGFRNRVITFFNWSYNYFSFDRGARLIIRKFQRN